jgi:PAS domain S-box-containing protein
MGSDHQITRSPDHAMNNGDRVNILMVDDQPAKLLSYEAILGELGENLIKATSGREALEHLLKTDVAVVLMDVSMPEIDGFEMAEIIRQHPRFQKTAIIFISAVHLTDIDRLKGYERGAVDYIAVPVVPEVLRAKVSVFSELHRKTRQLQRLNHELEQRVLERTEELRESETQFRTLANSIPQLAWMARPDGSVFWYNQRWYDYTGSTFEEMQGSGWESVHHPEHVERVAAGIRRCWQTGEDWEDTCPLRGKDGQYRWFLSRAVPIRDSGGNIVRWLGTSTDISSQRAADEQIRKLNNELKQRLAELETIMQVLPVGIAVAHDPECRIIIGNAALSELLGTTPGDNISMVDVDPATQPFEMYQSGLPIDGRRLPVPVAVSTGKPVNMMEFEIRRRDGSATSVLASAMPLFDDAGNVRGGVGAVVDVSARKQMEDMLRERAALLDLATEAIVVRDMYGKALFWNSGAENLYGWKREEILGKNLHQILQTRFPIPLEQLEARMVETGRWEGNLVQHTRDGREVTVACHKVHKVDGNRRVVLEINRDITAQLQAEDALRRTEKLAAMGRVAGIIAHEINNPLEAITNAFFLLRELPSLDDQARYYAKLAAEELDRIAHITRQTLSFYRESQQAVPLALSGILDDVLELQSRPMQRQGIKLERNYRSEGRISGFPAELKQVFLNLIGNAVQAMPEGGRLRLSICEATEGATKRRGVYIKISDTGTGIEPEHAKRLFEPFFTTKSVKGTGLGLWISKGIIQKYEGAIRFRSLRMNGRRTTCFSVFIPGLTAGNKSSSRAVA